MSKKVSGLVKAAASLSLAGGILTMAAGPAFAAGPNEAYGALATGLVHVGPLAEASTSGTSPVSLANLAIGSLLTTGIVTDTADGTSASSTIADPAVTLAELTSIGATAVTSSCTFNTNTGRVRGTASIADGAVSVGGIPTITLAANPAKNTAVTIPGVASLVLNQQITAGDGTLTVNAIAITLLGSTQTLTLGTSICNGADVAPVSILPGMATPIGLGTLGLLALGGTAYYVSKRRRVTVAA